ncbi:restriction endonuclease [Streptomyces sp. NBC_01728]|uniref:restriction endonuclease n=1 Tax=unclassified Streptomyces TaxID=2593676 RepID=UPI002258C410|nr:MULTISPECIES: restriction endonuclease [unclassified Streptomyces]MCX4455406.1 restriction endonuclease [Streptomyces sp. NBC_01719]MCX4494766.1 restriction endonuclease [Streptomyces sp. NBC_01728]
MINESALLESKSLRDSVLEQTDVLDRVKALSLLPDGMHVTTAMVAAYFGVTAEAIRQLKARHPGELASNGMVTLQGAELAKFKRDVLSRFPESYPQPRSSLTLYSRRAVLNVAMLLRDSDVARQVPTYLLDMEYLAHAHPVEEPVPSNTVSLDDRIDQRITHILGKTVVPMFNALIETSGEHRRELIALRAGVETVERRLRQHHARLQRLEGPREERPLAGVMASIDAMNGREFEEYVAELLRRDGCTNVVLRGGRGDRGIDITGRTADGRHVAVQCKRFAPYLSVTSPDVQKFVGAAKVLHTSEVALFVATCPFTPDALNVATDGGITAVHRGLLEEWSAGAALAVLE